MPIATMSQLEVGAMLDHYVLDAIVARSGMSTLYRATDDLTGEQVAIKVPHAEMESDPVLVERFRREQEIGQQLDHPGVVKTHSEGQRSRMYMVIEWVDGRLLRTVMNEAGKMPAERAVKFVLAICDALDTMHKYGVVHRDLKPENVMVLADDRIKIIDFGIAMKEDARRITHTGLSPALGTPDYISPEQVKGQRGDQRSDIYALGVMFYEMLTGQPPFKGSNPLVVMNERLLHDPEPARKLNPQITPQLQEILNRALVREPRQRYATATEMVFDLEHQEQLDVEDRDWRLSLHGKFFPGGRKMLMYAGLALVPVVLFAVMLMLAKR